MEEKEIMVVTFSGKVSIENQEIFIKQVKERNPDKEIVIKYV